MAICGPDWQSTVVLVSKDVAGQRLGNPYSLGTWLRSEREQKLDSI